MWKTCFEVSPSTQSAREMHRNEFPNKLFFRYLLKFFITFGLGTRGLRSEACLIGVGSDGKHVLGCRRSARVHKGGCIMILTIHKQVWKKILDFLKFFITCGLDTSNLICK